MGAKAKAAILEANQCLTRITTALNNTMQAFQGMVAQKKGKKDTVVQLAKYAQKKYPGVMDLTPHVATDPILQEIQNGIDKCREKIAGFRRDSQAQLLLLDQYVAEGKKALEKLDDLIIAKAKQQKEAKGLKKVMAKLKTKSLGDLRDTKNALDKTFETVNREALGIRMYFEKVNKQS
jgi:hypothetical protein